MLFTHVEHLSEERWRTGPGTNLKIWRIPQCPFLMECSSAVLEQIRQEAEGSRDLPRAEREIGGVLFGIQEPGRICILTSRPLQCEHAMGPGFVLSEKDEKCLTQLISAPATAPELSGLQPLGWYHSHIRSGIFLSERDLQIHSRYFAAPYQIALVIHPRSDGPARAGFFFRETSGEMRTESCYEEFTIAAPPPEREIKRPAPSTKEKSSRKASTGPKPPPLPLACPRCGSPHIRRSRRHNPLEQLRGLFGYRPYRCHECLSRSFLKTAELLDSIRPSGRKRPEERRRARLRTRREVLLWGGGIGGFMVILYYLIRDTGPKPDAP